MTNDELKANLRPLRGQWRRDPIKNGRRNGELLLSWIDPATPGTGWFIMCNRGTVRCGRVEGALPHITDGIFTVDWERKYKDWATAIAVVESLARPAKI